MKITHILGTLTMAALLLGGCAKPEAAGGDTGDHAGHDHAGHDHGAHAPGETNADGVEMCAEHGVPEAECGICQAGTLGTLKPGESLQVRLPSDGSAALVGIETVAPTEETLGDSITCVAEFAFDANKLARVVAPVAGIVQEVAVDVGAQVAEGQTLARLWSSDVAETVAQAILSHQALERERRLRAEGVAAEQDLQAAEAAHRAVCQQARTFGFSEDMIDAMGERPEETVLLGLPAPFAGEVVACAAVRGERVDAGAPLFTVVDRRTMWAMLGIPESALAVVRVGQAVELQVDGLPGRTFPGTLTWIAAELDAHTRLARARVEVSNPEGVLRARMFAQARILTSGGEGARVVPASAIQMVDGVPLVFVQRGADLYEARRVRLGPRWGGRVAVAEGLRGGEPLVAARGFAVKSQLLSERLGAGCAHE